MLTTQQLRDAFADLRKNTEPVNGTYEIVGESFLAADPSIFGATNEDYIKRELDWYLTGSLNVHDIPGGAPAIWKRVATPSGEINSNYGYLLLDPRNGDQLENVLKHLLTDLHTRRATAVYTRPSIHKDWARDGMQDFICTNAVQYLVRDGELQVIVQMRSNDVVFGFRNDYAWHRWTQEQLLIELRQNGIDLKAGRIIWHAASLHIYERHFWLLDHYIETGDPFPEITK